MDDEPRGEGGAGAAGRADADSAGGNSDATARSYGAGISEVQLFDDPDIAPVGPELAGGESILIESETSNVSITTRADGDLDAVGGDTTVISQARLNNHAKIEGYWEAVDEETWQERRNTRAEPWGSPA